MIVWIMFIVFRSIAVMGIGAYGESIHLRGGDLLFRTAASNFKLLLDPLNLSGFIPRVIDFSFTNAPLVILFALALTIMLWPGRVGLCVFIAALLPVLNIPASHRLYVASAGFALALGLSLGHVFTKLRSSYIPVATAVVLLIGLLGETVSVIHRNEAWTNASRITRFVTNETRKLLPAVSQHTAFYYYGLPETLNGAKVFQWGVPEAIQAAYQDRSLSAFRLTSEPNQGQERSLQTMIDNTAAEASQVFLIFDPDVFTLVSTTRDQFIEYVSSHAAR
jgi:hypothetical protein